MTDQRLCTDHVVHTPHLYIQYIEYTHWNSTVKLAPVSK